MWIAGDCAQTQDAEYTSPGLDLWNKEAVQLLKYKLHLRQNLKVTENASGSMLALVLLFLLITRVEQHFNI